MTMKAKKTNKAVAATTTRNWAAGDVVEVVRGGSSGGGAKNRKLATVWCPAACGGHYWLRFLKSSEVVRVPASRLRSPRLACAGRFCDVELEAFLTHVGGDRNDAARRERQEEGEEEDGGGGGGGDARSVSSSVGSNGGSLPSAESRENVRSMYSSDESRRRAEMAYTAGMIESASD